MKLRSVLGGGLALIVLVGAGALFFLYSSLNGVVKSAIEEYGGELLGTSVRVGSVRISPTTGEGTIRGVTVANPDGFPSGDALTLGEITLALDVGTLMGSPIVVKRVVIAAPAVYAVMGADGRTNLDVLRRNAERYTASPASQPVDSPTSSQSDDELLLRIEHFSFSDGSVSAVVKPEDGTTIAAPLPELDLRSLGGASGATPDEIGRTIVVAFTRAVSLAVTRAGAEIVISEYLEGDAGEVAKQLLRRFLK